MAGFIPMDQKFSKLSGNQQKINHYNNINQQLIMVSNTTKQEHLHVSEKRLDELETTGIIGRRTDIEPAEGYKKASTFLAQPKHDSSNPEQFEAQQRVDDQWDIYSVSDGERKKLMVLPYTADFDLLFIHPPIKDVDLGLQDRYNPPDPELGICSNRNIEIINALNAAYNRKDNPMVHHGADNKNPYTDMDANLPATVFIPKSFIGKLSIYTESPILIKTESELYKFYRAMRDNGIKIGINPLWENFKNIPVEPINKKISFFDNK